MTRTNPRHFFCVNCLLTKFFQCGIIIVGDENGPPTAGKARIPARLPHMENFRYF